MYLVRWGYTSITHHTIKSQPNIHSQQKSNKYVPIMLVTFITRYRERSWVNSYGKPAANREVIEPMLELYEKLGKKVKLNTGEQPVDNDTPF